MDGHFIWDPILVLSSIWCDPTSGIKKTEKTDLAKTMFVDLIGEPGGVRCMPLDSCYCMGSNVRIVPNLGIVECHSLVSVLFLKLSKKKRRFGVLLGRACLGDQDEKARV